MEAPGDKKSLIIQNHRYFHNIIIPKILFASTVTIVHMICTNWTIESIVFHYVFQTLFFLIIQTEIYLNTLTKNYLIFLRVLHDLQQLDNIGMVQFLQNSYLPVYACQRVLPRWHRGIPTIWCAKSSRWVN